MKKMFKTFLLVSVATVVLFLNSCDFSGLSYEDSYRIGYDIGRIIGSANR